MERTAPEPPSPTRDPAVRWIVLAGAAIAFALDLVVQPPTSAASVIGRLVGYPVTVGISFLFGRWLGTRTWPRRGRRLAKRLLARHIRKERGMLFLSHRADVELPLARRIWEVVGFAAGASVLLASIVVLFRLLGGSLAALAGFFILVFAWASFVLVPYWLFSRMGMRHVDAVRWLILPLSRRYADRMRLSNGALILLGLGAMINATLRTGASVEEAVVSGVLYIVRMVALILVIAATAVAYYMRSERGLVRELEAEAIALGVRDGRGMSDGQFLPGLRGT